jgi:hypothetical protein
MPHSRAGRGCRGNGLPPTGAATLDSAMTAEHKGCDTRKVSTGAGALERPPKSTARVQRSHCACPPLSRSAGVWHLRSHLGPGTQAAWLTMDMWAAHPKPRRPCIFLWPVHVTSREPVVFRMAFGRGHVSIASSNPMLQHSLELSSCEHLTRASPHKAQPMAFCACTHGSQSSPIHNTQRTCCCARRVC